MSVEIFLLLRRNVPHYCLSKVSQRFLEDEGRYNYTTPKSFLELIDFYKELLRKKRGELDGNIGRLANGLQTLRKTNNDVQVQRSSANIASVATTTSSTTIFFDGVIFVLMSPVLLSNAHVGSCCCIKVVFSPQEAFHLLQTPMSMSNSEATLLL